MMFCHKCGTQVVDGASFCPKCGEKMVSQEADVKQGQGVGANETREEIAPPPSRRSGGILGSRLFRRLAIVVVVMIIAAIFNSFKEDKYIKMVKEGSLTAYPQTTVGEAFDNFIGDASWESGESEAGERFVNVKGKIMYMDKKVDILIQFMVDEKNETFEYHACEMNDIPQDNLFFYGLLEKIYSEVKTGN